MSSDKAITSPKLIPSVRFTLALLVSFALFIQYAQRVSLSMAIVCMVNKTNINTTSKINSYDTLLQNSTMRPTIAPTVIKYGSGLLQEKQFVLTEFQQQMLLGAHYYGYLFGLIPGGWLSIKIGAKRIFLYGLLLSSICTLAMCVIYFLHDTHIILAVILRVLAGLGHAPLFPATYTFWSKWAVPLERSTLTAIGFCSSNLGTAVTMLIGGLLCRYVSSGWVFIFMSTGIFGFLWILLWLWLVADSPQAHRRISERERKYICENIGVSTDNEKKKSVSLSSLPWKKVIRSKPIIALLLTQFCNLFGLFFFYTNIGKILTDVHHIPPQYTGYVLAGGFILMPIVSLSTGILADRLVRAKKISLTNVRKLFNSLTSFIPAICMIILCFCDHTRQILAIITILILLAGSAISYGSGYVVNFADIAPLYSSIIFAVGTTISTIGAVLGNVIAGIVIKQPILDDWRKLFILFAATYTIGGIIFLLYGSAVPRKWATFNSEKSKENEGEGQSSAMLPQRRNIPLITITDETNRSIHFDE